MSQSINSGYIKDSARDMVGGVNLKYDLVNLWKVCQFVWWVMSLFRTVRMFKEANVLRYMLMDLIKKGKNPTFCMGPQIHNLIF